VLCRAKVNLTLHVGAPIASGGGWEGYHPVESLVVFADVGDRVSVSPADQTSLIIDGPFGEGLTAGPDNLILKAMTACEAPPQTLRLTKNLPVSSGLGGGSANAAAILRLFDSQGAVDAVSLGADVPVCRLSQTAMMTGIGERVTPLPDLGSVAAVLVNPRIPVSTARIFARFDDGNPQGEPALTSRTGSLLDRARSGTNALESAAVKEAPAIQFVLDALREQADCQLARMSGSGASCFGIFASDASARAAAACLSQKGWWAVATRLGDSGDPS